MAACRKGLHPGGQTSNADSLDTDMAGAAPLSPMGPRESEQWSAAAAGDAEEAMRLIDVLGCDGVRERAARAELRITAIRAMQHCVDFSELPWLVHVAAGGGDAEARAALETIDDLAATPRRATDPEDGDELHAGCVSLLSLARESATPRERRVLAVRALRMLSDRGCVTRSEIPKDLDTR